MAGVCRGCNDAKVEFILRIYIYINVPGTGYVYVLEIAPLRDNRSFVVQGVSDSMISVALTNF